MSVFGWSLPPGCTHRHIEEAYGSDEPCAVCGRWAEDCICPECRTCRDVGNPKCYVAHGMVCSAIQIASKAEADEAIRLDNDAADAAYRAAWAAAEAAEADNE